MSSVHVWNFVTEFSSALRKQLKEDELRWGDTWLERQKEGQEDRTWETFKKYFIDYQKEGIPVPWLKIAGNALICWIREVHPELWEKHEEIE